MAEWREGVGIMLRKAGELDKRIMFLFVDTQIELEGYVEDINSLLNTGEITFAESSNFRRLFESDPKYFWWLHQLGRRFRLSSLRL
jgi:dynein heavy chain